MYITDMFFKKSYSWLTLVTLRKKLHKVNKAKALKFWGKSQARIYCALMLKK